MDDDAAPTVHDPGGQQLGRGRRSSRLRDLAQHTSEEHMYWGLGILYVVLLVTLGVMTLRNRHGWLFFFGIFFPILWIVGAVMRPART
jgi:hypothetical protein